MFLVFKQVRVDFGEVVKGFKVHIPTGGLVIRQTVVSTSL